MALFKTPTNITQSILAFVKNLVPKPMYKAISIIISPCCTLSGTINTPSCGEGDSYTFTITTNESIGFLGNGIALISIDGKSLTGVITEPNTIFVENLSLSSPGTYELNVTLLLPTNSGGTVGAFKTFTIAEAVFPSCV